MATLIPRHPGPQVGLQQTPNVRNTARVDMSPAINAAQQAGSAMQDALGKYRERAELTILQGARRELSEWERAVRDPRNPNGIDRFRGKDALVAGDTLLPDYDSMAGNIRNRLPAHLRPQFDMLADRQRETVSNWLTSHASQEYEKFENAEHKATLDTLMQDAVAAGVSGDFLRQQELANEALFINRAFQSSRGMGAELQRQTERSIVSGVHAATIDGVMTTDPFAAQQYYARWADQMAPEDRAKVERALYPIVEDGAADAITDSILAGVPAQADDPATVVDAIVGLESGGRDDARNPRSSATGAGQFIDATWLQTVKRHRPDLAEGRDDAQLLAMRTDGALSREMTAAYARDNAAFLQASSVPTTAANLYAAHHFGPKGGVDFARATPDTPMSEILSAGQMRANPYLQGKTKAEALANWQARGLPVVEGGAVGAPPASEADALALAQGIRDPRLRNAVTRKVRERFQIQQLRTQEAERAVSERVHLTVETADPRSGAKLTQIMTPDDYATAAAKGWIPSLEERWLRRQKGEPVTSSPTTVLALEEIVYRAALGREANVDALRNLNPYDPTLSLSPEDRKRFADAQLKLLSGEQKQVASVASEAEINSIIKQYTVSTLGIPEKQIGKDNDQGRKAWQFNVDMRTWATQFEQDNKRKPSFIEVQEHADLLTLQGEYTAPGRLWGTRRENFRVADLDIPSEQLSQITEALQIEGKAVTAEAIADKWRRFGGAQ